MDCSAQGSANAKRTYIKDLKIVRGLNSVRISGILGKSNGYDYTEGCIIISNMNTTFWLGKPYTLTYNIKDNLGTLEKPGSFAISGNNYFLKNKSSKYVRCLVATVNTDTKLGFGALILLTKGENIPFDITLTDFSFYEGLYVNPPSYPTPTGFCADIKAKNTQNLYKMTYGNDYEKVVDNNGVWVRVAKLSPDMDFSVNSRAYNAVFDGFVFREWHEIFTLTVSHVTAWALGGRYNNYTPSFKAYLKAERTNVVSSGTSTYNWDMNKFRIAYSPVDSSGKSALYLETFTVLRTNTAYNDYQVVVNSMHWHTNSYTPIEPECVNPYINGFSSLYGYNDVSVLEVNTTDVGSAISIPS